jgi:hypothetical protein
MKNIHNALSDVMEQYKSLDCKVVDYIAEDALWVVNVWNRDVSGSLLQIEVIDDDGIPKCSVLQKVNVGRKSMFKFMNRLVDALDE